MKTPEGKIKDMVKDFLNSLGEDCWYYCPVPMGYGRRGIPDFIGCYKGTFFSIETKTKIVKLKPWQERENAAIRKAKGQTWVFDKDFGYIQFEAAFRKWFKIKLPDDYCDAL